MNFMKWAGGSGKSGKGQPNKGWTDEVEAMDKPLHHHAPAPSRTRKASLNALSASGSALPPPPSSSSSSSSSAPSLASSSSSTSSSNGPSMAALEEKAQEYERRINVLTFCLEEQVMENAQLQKRLDTLTALYGPPSGGPGGAAGKGMGMGMGLGLQSDPVQLFERVKALESQLRERDDQLEELHEARTKVEDERDELRRELTDLHKKMAALARDLDDLKASTSTSSTSDSSTSVSTTNSSSSGGSTNPSSTSMMGDQGAKEKNWEDRYKREKRDKKRMEDLVFSYEETIERLKQSAKAKEKKYRTFAQRLEHERDRRAALQESNEEYEKKLQLLEKDLMDALHKEGERRMEAEYWQDSLRKKLKKLKKKLKKLQTASGEGEATSDSDESSTSETSTETEKEEGEEASAD